jgi:predicted RNase H-like HicB family nuclease
MSSEAHRFCINCQELGIASQGKTVREAKKNIKEAIQLYLEESKNSKVLKSRYPILTTINAYLPTSNECLSSYCLFHRGFCDHPSLSSVTNPAHENTDKANYDFL